MREREARFGHSMRGMLPSAVQAAGKLWIGLRRTPSGLEGTNVARSELSQTMVPKYPQKWLSLVFGVISVSESHPIENKGFQVQ
jgi:hypothetical protein